MEDLDIYVKQEDWGDLVNNHHLHIYKTESRFSNLEKTIIRHRIVMFLMLLLIGTLLLNTIYVQKRITEIETRISKQEVKQATVVAKSPICNGIKNDDVVCPVCGWVGQYYPIDGGWYIECSNPECKCHTHINTKKEDALLAWNDAEVYSDVF